MGSNRAAKRQWKLEDIMGARNFKETVADVELTLIKSIQSLDYYKTRIEDLDRDLDYGCDGVLDDREMFKGMYDSTYNDLISYIDEMISIHSKKYFPEDIYVLAYLDMKKNAIMQIYG